MVKMLFTPCKRCGSYAINPSHHGRDGSDSHLCDVCYWRKRAELASLDSNLLNELDAIGGDELGLQKTKTGWWAIPKGKLSPVHYDDLRSAISAALGKL